MCPVVTCTGRVMHLGERLVVPGCPDVHHAYRTHVNRLLVGQGRDHASVGDAPVPVIGGEAAAPLGSGLALRELHRRFVERHLRQ